MDEKTVDYVAECRRLEKAVALLESQLQHETRVIAVLVAVGKLKQGHVEEARSIVSSLGD